MSDIFQEVDEAVRQERFKQLWDRYGNFVIAAAVLVVIGVGGWRGYQWWEGKKAAESGFAFDAAVALAEQGKAAEAEAAFQKVATDGTRGYRTLAQLRDAALIADRDPKAAVAAYDAIASDSSAGTVMQDLATLRAAALLIDTAPLAEITRRLEPLAAPDRAFRHSARELLAVAAAKAPDAVALKKWFDAIQADPETPQSIRARVEILVTLSDTAKS